ncbi:MAG: cob(I)alamin adenolsyltransferase/cobinamide ATP-dependent adenolsyltransferase [Candidatus Methanofastidiosum methylothiophilum]|jgi:cob(I)alamin adenosyltransferase|uniref:Cob(I)alamin adenolsyltransferase/cobinamide ATP-dependent adenolsyltransferase n=1 Tax=Candidatus Methanofastidiosum methylothiophilum TaxID=1705564 RepID=A0A150JFG1_9EURY|nr:MAG: cob(I)alamin adenolsyltransferase/cobinamide ATP-dependent adenolsyltransferase [Candidatus Methanofastidiosum methylthiophilus]OQC51383.1 MAG: cob(I)alamin adenolsyltransferase/cobinamide ATP-dependent adenolsyltransferase [Euryarchaeota archaeon ADurb.Bin023]HNV94443.1 cob(I)yrinic acid a,c-diamide adenosyltransferase [Methanofastidiosum sp.]KYC55989.1 MAG: cob(I)alamin adenolsyltransferase/cobinamide ATP-dependent adenolsyltransferase [Candidatus Methanofastidiosum methylthiophilus]K
MKGLIQIYTGTGKGKSTAAFGLTLRASGYGLKSLIIQFMKQGNSYGEHFAINKLENIEIVSFGKSKFIDFKNPSKEDIDLVNEAWDFATKSINIGKYDIIVLDEINVALNFKLLNLEKVIDVLKNKPDSIEIILTGRYAPKELIEIADLVSEIVEVKHPYQKGIIARKGIEY